ncbi:xanthine dehydrogenase family protein molybdopterin-binding subunit [Scleromatobacter humisilvae]|uniref:Xanthine dehydrogenase family protein molybdopterin-binding subunit n=1 Tax=Scleromatobacter humisilvae TaxID=2897159 RepID=A0A9X1YI81_9BURK|nr:xanthine dehydrogenase family protein molybdopterin-binding subunit [Scleromatobacter humisilvae]MCK9686202.1 xanthine dehydrogenase family protein molybdopterin-binding subunit [Scleromatobacter humisilvae]
MTSVGAPLDRVDGPLKVCGQAHYTGDLAPPRMAHAVLVTSTIASGRIARIDAAAAERAPGVVAVITHANAMKLPQDGKAAAHPPEGRVLSLLQDDQVAYSNQPIAVVVAETIEQANGAAALVRVTYARAEAKVDFEAERPNAYAPDKFNGAPPDTTRGDIEAGLASAAHRVELGYTTPFQHHNPMEPHATLASWDGEKLSIEDSTQYVAGVRRTLAKTFGIPPELVHVRSSFVGGAFGGKGSAWSHVILAAMAARQLGRPVRLVMQRPQLFGPVGGRPRTAQTLRVGCDEQGRLTALEHQSTSTTSVIEDWVESCAVVTRQLYASPAVATAHRLVKLNVGTPTFQRAPGESTGMFALESALDELAFAAGIDPIEFRLRNDAPRDEQKNAPYSSKSLAECYRVGAGRIGWSRRSTTPGALRDGHWLVGLGCASATRPAKRSPCAARVRITADGRALVSSSTSEIGCGNTTVMAQVAADALGLPVGRVRFELGDTRLPEAPISAGSMTMESVGSAVDAACADARSQLVAKAIADPESPLHGAAAEDVTIEDGWLRAKTGEGRRDNVAVLLSRLGGAPLVADGNSKPGDEDRQFSMNSFGAVFAEVHVDRDLGIVRVPRIVGRFGAGRIINAKTAHSQLLGGIVWGLGMALTEESVLDPRSGRFVNANLAEYHVMVNADIGDIDVGFVDEVDPHVNSLGAKGLGEVSMTGVTGAVANAIFNATGKRVRDLPITLDKLL